MRKKITPPLQSTIHANDVPGASSDVKDNRQQSAIVSQMKESIQNSPRTDAQREAFIETLPSNHTGMPDNLKAGLENLSGIDLSDVKVHYNSDKPAHLQAHAYAQGNEIHLGPGQEKHLPHEGWHVVQQKQGRVKPTIKTHGTRVNDDKRLEHEADLMGGKALDQSPSTNCNLERPSLKTSPNHSQAQRIVQRVRWCDIDVPESISGVGYERRSDTVGYYWLAKENSKIAAIIKGMGLHDVHLHLVDNNVVVTVTSKAGGGFGEQTAHYEFSVGRKGLIDITDYGGRLKSQDGPKALGSAMIRLFAQAARLDVNTQLPPLTIEDLGQMFGGDQYKRLAEDDRKRVAEARKKVEHQQTFEERVREETEKLAKVSGGGISLQQDREIKERVKREMAASSSNENDIEKKPAKRKSENLKEEEDKGKGKEIEEDKKPSTDDQPTGKKAKLPNPLEKSVANKILNQFKKDEAFLKKFSLNKSTSGKQVALAMSSNPEKVTGEEMSRAIGASGITPNFTGMSTKDIIDAIYEAVT